MKSFCVFSDLHLHPWQYGSTIVNGRNSRLEQQKQVVKDIIAYCTERDISQCVFTGDLFHASTVIAEASQAAYEAFKGFKENKIALTIIVGNHDQSSRSGGTHALSWFREFGQLIDASMGAISHKIAGKSAVFIPYLDDKEELRRRIDKFREGFLFLHQGVGGVEVNSKGFTLNEILTPDMIPAECSMAFTGHYHSHKLVTPNLIIPGSTMQHNWGDQGEPRGWLDVAVDNGRVQEIELVPSNAPRFITVTPDELHGHDEIERNFIRVLSNGDHSPEELTSHFMQMGAASVEIKQTITSAPLTKVEASSHLSFHDTVMAYAVAKEQAGIITDYDKTVGESLLSGTYQMPSV